MNVLSSEDRYVLMGREVTVRIGQGEYRNGYALGYEVGAIGRVLVLWTHTASGGTEASWIWPDQVLQTTGDHLLEKLRDRDYTGADQAAFERFYHAAIAVADEPAPVLPPEEVRRPFPTNGELGLSLGIIAFIIFIFLFFAFAYRGW